MHARTAGGIKRARRGSNLQPSVSKTDALSSESLKNKPFLNEANEATAVATAVGMEIEPRNASEDPDLAALLAAWETLPSALKAGIVAMVKAAQP